MATTRAFDVIVVGEGIAGLSLDGKLAIVPNTTHFLTRERPDLVDELILDFLAE